ncbi:hypothetical protein BpHYR1_014205 [Brachionus plicatilis]|uniref:Uncharacterized protein n=1 Tax=Brachionus plicatilis TaxID=10195 RepID=A0A3M7S9E2_BRAPC|nr:hypothetical protein BpHYR1_014205 [Brachionus plicatilis]
MKLNLPSFLLLAIIGMLCGAMTQAWGGGGAGLWNGGWGRGGLGWGRGGWGKWGAGWGGRVGACGGKWAC